MQCNEIGQWSVANTKVYPLMSTLITEDWWQSYCFKIFGNGTHYSGLNIQKAAQRYGQLGVTANNVQLTSMTYDPWQYAALLKPDNVTQPTILMEYFDCPLCDAGRDFQKKNALEESVEFQTGLASVLN